jgi:hypothetical protein
MSPSAQQEQVRYVALGQVLATVLVPYPGEGHPREGALSVAPTPDGAMRVCRLSGEGGWIPAGPVEVPFSSIDLPDRSRLTRLEGHPPSDTSWLKLLDQRAVPHGEPAAGRTWVVEAGPDTDEDRAVLRQVSSGARASAPTARAATAVDVSAVPNVHLRRLVAELSTIPALRPLMPRGCDPEEPPATDPVEPYPDTDPARSLAGFAYRDPDVPDDLLVVLNALGPEAVRDLAHWATSSVHADVLWKQMRRGTRQVLEAYGALQTNDDGDALTDTGQALVHACLWRAGVTTMTPKQRAAAGPYRLDC